VINARSSRRAFSAMALTLGFVVLLAVTNASTVKADEANRVIDITAKRFAFTPNTVTLKKGEKVMLRLHSEDVTHGFFMRALKIDEVIEPGQTKDIVVNPQTAGSFTTICDHFCGANHGNMNMTIVVE
jgi:cytochrome c oxidase subunit II